MRSDRMLLVGAACAEGLALRIDESRHRDEVVDTMKEAVSRHGGTIDTELGDGLLAFFGTPTAHEDDAERAILAALDIRSRLGALGPASTAGINTGVAFIQTSASRGCRDVTVRGRVINLAARLQASARPGQVLVGETTYHLNRLSFSFSPVTLQLKGVDRPVTAYEVRARAGRPKRARGIEGLTAELQGRQQEMRVLEGALESVLGGSGRLVLLVGDAGVGKSRLVAELKRRADGRRGSTPYWLEGRCLESGTATSYLPYVEILQQVFGFRPDDDDRAREGKISSTMTRLSVTALLGQQRAEEIVPVLATLLSVQPRERVAALVGSTTQQLMNQTLKLRMNDEGSGVDCVT
jgi:hypothetical protein